MSDVDGRLAEIRERCEAATAGEWNVDPNAAWHVRTHGSTRMSYFDYTEEERGLTVADAATAPDAAFIAAARSDVPFLLAELAVARGQVERVEELCDDTLAAILREFGIRTSDGRLSVSEVRAALSPSREQATP